MLKVPAGWQEILSRVSHQHPGSTFRQSRAAWPSPTTVQSLILQIAVQSWPLLAISFLANLILVICESITFIVIFYAVIILQSPFLSASSQGILPIGKLFGDLSRGQQFAWLLLAAFCLQILMSCSRYAAGLSAHWLAARCQAQILPTLHRHLLSLSLSCIARFRLSYLVNVVGRAPFSVQIPIYESERIASNSLLVIVCLVSLVWLDYRLAIVAIFMGIIIAYSQRLLQSPISAASRKQLELSRQMGVSMLEDLQLLRLLHSSSSLFHSELHIRQCGKDLEKSMVRLSFLSQLLEPIGEILPFLAITVIGAFSWIFYHGNGERLVPSLVVFVLIIQRLNSRLTSISSSLNRLAENEPALEDLADVLNPAGKEFRRVGGLPFKGLFSRIDIEDVSFAYEISDGPSLAHVNLRIPMGSKTALVGRSGSGKSTLMDLLVGLHAPTSGQIYVDGIDLQTLDLDQWQNHLGVVSQDVLLIHGSVSANIAFGLSGVGSDQIAEAARLADAEAFILDLPSGYDTVVGDRGMRLSGGQRQRLSLARALLRQPQLLILDEATSALDSLSETRILKTIKKVFSQITILSVAHRLSSISDADLIIVLDQGRVVEQGDHAELMQLNGLYATLWRLQATQSSSER